MSARHVSWLETGKANPSREMVLVLASALDLPLRERNELLLAADFAPAYAETPLDADAMADVRHALHLLQVGAHGLGLTGRCRSRQSYAPRFSTYGPLQGRRFPSVPGRSLLRPDG